MKKTALLIPVFLVILGLAIWALWPQKKTTNSDSALTLYCAAGLRSPVSEIINQYEKETGRHVKVIYNGSGALLSQIQIGGGDLYLPASNDYIEEAKKLNLTAETIPVASMSAVIVVDKNNNSIHTLNDLTQPNVKISFADPSAAIGKFTRNILRENKLLEKIQKNVTVTKPTVNNIVEDVTLGSVDATIAWDAVASNYPAVKLIHDPILDQHPQTTSITVLKSSQHPTEALHFARYLSAKDKGLPIFKKHHFTPVALADQWADTPDVVIFSGSMLRPAIDDRIHAFEKREGCKISTVYEGCGTLVAQMKAGADPAFYFSCDTTFLDQVKNKFEPGTIVTKNEIILLVPKGNPKNLHTLDDISKPGLKIGLAHPVKSALGKLTRVMLKNSHHLEKLQKSNNIVIMASKGDELVTQMQVGALDAALLYRSNALASESISKNCTIISLNRPDAIATQPYATALDTPYPNLLHRLGEYLTNSEAKKTFLHYGFTWKKN